MCEFETEKIIVRAKDQIYEEYEEVKKQKSINEYIEELTDMLLKLFRPVTYKDVLGKNILYNKGQIMILFQKITSLGEKVPLMKRYSYLKIKPKRKKTVSIAELIFNMNKEGNNIILFDHTRLIWHDFMYSKHFLAIDIDDFPIHHLSKKEALKKIKEKYLIFKIFPPNYIIDSGNKGFHLYYLFNEDIKCYRYKISEMARMLNLYFGGDRSKNAITTGFAMPFTINHTTGKIRRCVYEKSEETDRYCFDELYNNLYEMSEKYFRIYRDNYVLYAYENYEGSIFDTEKESFEEIFKDNGIKPLYKKNKRIVSEMTSRYPNRKSKISLEEINRFRILDIKKWICDYKYNDIMGSRNTIFMILASCYLNLGYEKADTLNELKKINNNLHDPYHINELIDVICSVYRNEYKFSNKKIHELLYMPDFIRERSRLSYTDEERIKKKKACNSRRYNSSQQAKNAKKSRILKAKKIFKIQKELKAGKTASEIINEMDVPRSTAYLWIKKFCKGIYKSTTFILFIRKEIEKLESKELEELNSSSKFNNKIKTEVLIN